MQRSMHWKAACVMCVGFLFMAKLCFAQELCAKATIVDTTSKVVGTAVFKEVKGMVTITVDVKDLKPGPHALHIHEVGKCEGPEFKSAGGHFNPFGKEHGFNNPKGSHAGDFYSILAGENGRAHAVFSTKAVTLQKGKPHSLLKDGGTAIVIHAGPDDYMTNPAGASGARIACGVIEEFREECCP